MEITKTHFVKIFVYLIHFAYCSSSDDSEEEESDEDMIVDLNFEPNINKK